MPWVKWRSDRRYPGKMPGSVEEVREDVAERVTGCKPPFADLVEYPASEAEAPAFTKRAREILADAGFGPGDYTGDIPASGRVRPQEVRAWLETE